MAIFLLRFQGRGFIALLGLQIDRGRSSWFDKQASKAKGFVFFIYKTKEDGPIFGGSEQWRRPRGLRCEDGAAKVEQRLVLL